jgi:toxin ParE1/3/4
MRVVWTQLATEQLDEAMAYIAQDRPATAAEWLEDILDLAGSLADFPDQGKMVPEAEREEIRELILAPYRLIYRRDEKAVYVTMLLHSRRHLSADDVE